MTKALAAFAGLWLLLWTVSASGQLVEGLSAVDVFAAAELAQGEGRSDDALKFYEALTHDPDQKVRNEARFRKGRLLSLLGRNAEAAVLYRAILDDEPDATAVRLELARLLAQLGDDAGARRALRQAQAAGLPQEVALVVDQFARALRSTRPAGGSFEIGIAPDSNINRATNQRTLDTVIAPLTLSNEAREQSGIGLQSSVQIYGRLPITKALALVPRASGRGTLYKKTAFNDVSASTLVGIEWRIQRDRLTPSVGRTWRWYGRDLYATTDALSLAWLHPLGPRAQLTVSGTAAQANYRKNSQQSGGLYDLSATLEHALSPRSGLGGTVGATRQSAKDPGYSTTAGSLALFGWRDVGRTTFFASTTVRRLGGDARLFLFPERRKEWLKQLSAGATLRWLTVAGFAPVVRLTAERNVSTVGLYDYKRVSSELAITRAW